MMTLLINAFLLLFMPSFSVLETRT